MGLVVNILAIETATTSCAIGVRSGSTEVTRVLDVERRHTEVLVPGIEALLQELGISVREIDRVVVDVGPGLFTGLRVGIATAIGFSEGLGVGMVAVTSLEVLAHGAFDAGVRGSLVSAVDGRRGEVFIQTFDLGDHVEPVSKPEVAIARNVVIEWATNGAPVTFTGDGVERYLKDFSAVPNGNVEAQSVPSIAAALELASKRQVRSSVSPLYLREADAVANFTTRTRPQ